MAQVFSCTEEGIDADGKVILALTMDDDLYQGLVAAAARAGMTLEDFIAQAIENELKRTIADHIADAAPTAGGETQP